MTTVSDRSHENNRVSERGSAGANKNVDPLLLKRLKKYSRSERYLKKRYIFNGEEIGKLLSGYTSIIDFIPLKDSPCISDASSRKQQRAGFFSSSEGSLEEAAVRLPLTHRQLRKFIEEDFDLRKFGIARGCRIALLLPNGPELAVAVIAALSGWCVVPINATYTSEEIRAELEGTKSQAIIILAGATVNDAAIDAATSLNIGVLIASPFGHVTGLFRLAVMHTVPDIAARMGYTVANTVEGFTAFDHPETVLLLHTSGTSGNKKLVPYSLDMIITGVGCIVSSWDLQPSDVCLNMMPLFHIGGIMRNILSPVLSGGCVITCTGFDPVLFWEILSARSDTAGGLESSSMDMDTPVDGHPTAVVTLPCPTWYYAAPTMHHAILSEGDRREKPLPVQSIRFIANAAGGLLPVLADSLKSTFCNAIILTSYGMTECMPISTPPQTYKMDPMGTSGVKVGPDIVITDDDMKPVSIGVKGNIMVRGPPCFGGYLNNGAANDESFFEINGLKGWFNTGDMGSLDNAGYLFISGRSKEIINRGGETISPFEIEEAIQQHPSIKETLAFSAPHEQYQETVGCVLVMRPGSPRIDLPTLHSYLEGKLHRSKWPFVIVYSDGLPKNAANKILRIKYAERTSMPTIDEDTPPGTRLYECKCPPVGSPVSSPIELKPVSIAANTARDLLLRQEAVSDAAVVLVDLPFKSETFVAFIVIRADAASSANKITEKLTEECTRTLHCYEAPLFIHPLPEIPKINTSSSSTSEDENEVNKAALVSTAQRIYAERNVVKPRNSLEEKIEGIWRDQFGIASGISVLASFFDIGGDSLKAGQMIHAMRQKLHVMLSVTDLFSSPTIEALAQRISMLHTLGASSFDVEDARDGSDKDSDDGLIGNGEKSSSSARRNHHNPLDSIPEEEGADAKSPFFSKSLPCLFFQSAPILLIAPLRRIFVWMLIAGVWVALMDHGMDRLYGLIVAIIVGRMTMKVLAPLVAVAAKWLIIGRYQPGRYPLWGSMYLRWWLVEQIINIMGTGIYLEGSLPGVNLAAFYYRLMGASIGRNLKISSGMSLAQMDLITIGDDVCIDSSSIRPFAVEQGHFILLPIIIGDRCCIGVKNFIAPGAHISSDTCLPPLSSSYETEDAHSSYRAYCRPTFPSPPFWLVALVGWPIFLIILAVKLLPWLYGLNLMVTAAKVNGWYDGDITTIYDAFMWWTEPERLLYYIALRLLRRCITPFLELAMVILVKHLVIGKFRVLSAQERAGGWNVFKYWLMAKLVKPDFCGVAQLVGTHYEGISTIFRFLGAKVGKHVYWPGSGLDMVEFDLLEVGDDVVFGSRSVVLTSSSTRSAAVVFEAGTMVADRCVILPGVRLQRGSVLGSGSLAPEDMITAVGSVWVGSTKGSAVNMGPEDLSYNMKDTTSPFGRAFYKHKATYFVFPQWLIVIFNTFWQAFCTVYRSVALPVSLIIASLFIDWNIGDDYNPWQVLEICVLFFLPVSLLFNLTALLVDITSKWLIIGRRKAGEFPWDQSSYCQRWQLYLTIEEIRRGDRSKSGILDMIQGSQYLVWYYRALGSRIGRNVCLFPNGGDPMMTEPDLVTIGDYTSVDDASLVAHINTRGIFRLNPLVVGRGCVLRSGTRLLSGASMDAQSIMLEHTLVLAGECLDKGMVWQGWPSQRQLTIAEHRKMLTHRIDHEQRKIAEAITARAKDRGTTCLSGCNYYCCCSSCCCCCGNGGDEEEGGGREGLKIENVEEAQSLLHHHPTYSSYTENPV